MFAISILMWDGHHSSWYAFIPSKTTIIYFPSQKVVLGIHQQARDADLINCNMVVAVGSRDRGDHSLLCYLV